MTMADVFGIVFVFVGLLLALPALWLLYGAIWPSALGRAEERIVRNPVATFFAGIGGSLFFVLAAEGLYALHLGPLALVVGSLGFSLSLFGTAALARHVGSRLQGASEGTWRSHLGGGLALGLAFLVPFAGWVLVFPLSLLLGMGAAVLSLVRRSAPRPSPVQAERAEVLA